MDETPKTEENISNIEKVDDSKCNGRKRPPPEPLPSRTRSTRAVKAAKRAYSPPLPSSSSSSKRATRPSNKSKVVTPSLPAPPLPLPPPPQPAIVKIVKEKEPPIKINKESTSLKNKPTTFDGQLELIHRASNDNKFAHTLVSTLNHHADKVVDNVRAKRNKNKNKLSRAMILQEMKSNKRIDINTPESILTSVSLASIINRKNFEKLPSYYQYRLTKLLPKCDQNIMPNQVITPSESSFNNEFFARALASFSYRLSEGRLTNETMAKLKREMEREKKNLDPLKVKYFEPFFKDPEEKSSIQNDEKQFEQDLSFLQTMSNCFEVVKCFCQNETFGKPVNIIRKGTATNSTDAPSVHFCETVRSDDGKSMQIKETLSKGGKHPDASANLLEKYKSEMLIPMLPKEKKTDTLTEEVLNCVDQLEFERKFLNPTRVILAPRQEGPLFSRTGFSQQESPTKLSPQKPIIIDTNRQHQRIVVSSMGGIIPLSQILQTANNSTFVDQRATLSASANMEDSKPLVNTVPIHFNKLPKGPKPKTSQRAKAPPKAKRTVGGKHQGTNNFYASYSHIKDALDGKLVIPRAIASHVPFSKYAQDYSQNWGKYTQSMYFINSLITKFIDQIRIYKKNFRKLHLACKVIFFSLDYLYTTCSDFLKSMQRLPNFPNVSLAINPIVWDPVGLPEEVNTSLQQIENISNECLEHLLNCRNHDFDTLEDEYLSNTNDSIVRHMTEHGVNVTSTLFERIKKQFITATVFSYIDHVEYLRAAYSYRCYCITALEVINSGLETTAGAGGDIHQLSHLMPLVTASPVRVTM